jgi:hypothetical protein
VAADWAISSKPVKNFVKDYKSMNDSSAQCRHAVVRKVTAIPDNRDTRIEPMEDRVHKKCDQLDQAAIFQIGATGSKPATPASGRLTTS